MDDCAPENSRDHCADDAGRQNRSHLPGAHSDSNSNLGNAIRPDRRPSQETVEQVALRELREEAGYELAKDGELIALGQYFTSPGFTDERGYFFLARPVQKCKEASAGDEGESILDCREFSVAEIRRMIAENEIRDANTLSIWARLSARALLPGQSS